MFCAGVIRSWLALMEIIKNLYSFIVVKQALIEVEKRLFWRVSHSIHIVPQVMVEVFYVEYITLSSVKCQVRPVPSQSNCSSPMKPYMGEKTVSKHTAHLCCRNKEV